MGNVSHQDTYKLLGLGLRDIVHKALGRVEASKIIEIIKEVFALDWLDRTRAFISMVQWSLL